MSTETEINVQKLKSENERLKDFVEKLYTVSIRVLFSIKQLIRIGAICGCYYWLGGMPTIALALFIILLMIIQAGIDKFRVILKPNLSWELKEWSFRVY